MIPECDGHIARCLLSQTPGGGDTQVFIFALSPKLQVQSSLLSSQPRPWSQSGAGFRS